VASSRGFPPSNGTSLRRVGHPGPPDFIGALRRALPSAGWSGALAQAPPLVLRDHHTTHPDRAPFVLLETR
jgi:hypothetical protein